MRPGRLAVATLMVGLLGGCSSAVGGSPPGGPSTTTVASPLDEAVDAAAAAGSYAFSGELRILAGDGAGTVGIDGWVDGEDRTIVISSGTGEVRTTVIDGRATVEGPDGPVETPLEQAASAPSISVLTGLDDVTIGPDGSVTGLLREATASDDSTLAALGGDAEATVRLTPAGTLAGYELRDVRGRWTVEMTFFDFGETFSE